MKADRRATKTPNSGLRVAAVQMQFAATIGDNLACIERGLTAAADEGADAVLFPECATTGYGEDFSWLTPSAITAALEHVGQLARRFRTNVLLGTPVYRGRKRFNGLVVFDRAGRIVYCYAKCHLTEMDRQNFAPGNAIALFPIDGVSCTTVICHERRYPELVRLAVMAGAQVLFHPNAGLDAWEVSRRKRGGRDGIAARAFENAIYYVFANTVGPQGLLKKGTGSTTACTGDGSGPLSVVVPVPFFSSHPQGQGRWSAGDSKIVAPDERLLALADNRNEAVIVADLDLTQATRSYALRGLQRPRFLAAHWKQMVAHVRRQAASAALDYDLPDRLLGRS